MACPSVCEPHNAPLSGHLDAALLENKTVASVKSQHPVDAERPLLPSRAANLTVFLRFLVALAPVRGLLLFAKHLFVVAIATIASCHARMFAGTRKLSSQSKLAFDFASPCAKTCCAKIRQMIEIDPA
jgi:hypothetical protein